MSRPEEFEKLISDNNSATQTLRRTPEPEMVTTADGSVNDYQAMMKSNMTANYALSLDLIHRTRDELSNKSALDLCCGPGHLTLCLSEYLHYEHAHGVDLSPAMIEAAELNTKRQGLSKQISFSCQDVVKLSTNFSQRFDLVSMTNAAHHLPNIQAVRSVLEQAEKLAQPHGLIFVSDLARLKSSKVTERFVALVGAEYGPHMKEDFFHSMQAAWLPEELSEAVPLDSKRHWYSIRLGGLPFIQALVGLPIGRKELYVRPSFDWEGHAFFPEGPAVHDWKFLTTCLNQGTAQLVGPQTKKGAA